MDKSTAPQFEIPKSPERAPVYSGAAERDPSLRIEQTKEILPAPAPGPAIQPQGTIPVIQQTIPQPVPQATVSDDRQSTILVADDVDVMEKEWVERAKKVVSLTSNDPYLEAKELYKLKNAYMKQRFNKELPQMQERDRK